MRERQTSCPLFEGLEWFYRWNDYIDICSKNGEQFERYFRTESAPEILFKCESLPRDIAESEKAGEGTTTSAGAGVDGTGKRSVTYGIQGSMIGRADKNGPQGDGINEDVSFTLNTTDRHAVAYGVVSKGNGEAWVTPERHMALNTGGGQAGQGYPAVLTQEPKVYGIGAFNSEGMKSDNPHSGIYEADTSRIIDQNGGNPACNQGGIAIVQTYQKVTGPLMANSHPGSYTGQDAYSDMLITDGIRSFTPSQFGQYQEDCGTLRANGGDYGGGSENLVQQHYTVRRLTPTECERLQGYPDGWTEIPGTTEVSKEEIEFWRGVWYTWDKMQSEEPEEVSPRTDKAILRWLKNPTSDTAQYKALGNSVAVPCVTWIMGQIANVLRKDISG